MDKTIQPPKQLTLTEWFSKIVQLHGRPAYVLLKINENTTFTLLAVASNEQNLKETLDRKQQDKFNYFG